MNRRRRMHPLTRLVIALRAASNHITLPAARAVAAQDAERIPKSGTELGSGHKSDMARLGRRTLAALPKMPSEEYDEAVKTLCACADALAARFEVTSQTCLGRQNRPSAA